MGGWVSNTINNSHESQQTLIGFLIKIIKMISINIYMLYTYGILFIFSLVNYLLA